MSILFAIFKVREKHLRYISRDIYQQKDQDWRDWKNVNRATVVFWNVKAHYRARRQLTRQEGAHDVLIMPALSALIWTQTVYWFITPVEHSKGDLEAV